jgi:hypothetical protein
MGEGLNARLTLGKRGPEGLDHKGEDAGTLDCQGEDA